MGAALMALMGLIALMVLTYAANAGGDERHEQWQWQGHEAGGEAREC